MNKETEFKYDLSSLEPYVLGKSFTGKAKERQCFITDELENFLTALEENSIAKEFFNAYELAANFYDTMVDFKHIIPKDVRVDVFYAAKVGYYYKEIPPLCVYVLQRAWEQCYGIPNLLLKVVPVSFLKKFFEEDYFLGGLNLKDIICNVCTEEYNPLSFYHPRNKLSDFTEIYIQSADMVAAVPHSIADCLDDESINSIIVTPNGLQVNGMYIRTMANRVGAVSSIYDLREVI